MEAKMIKQFLKHKCNSKIKLFIAVICMFALVMSVSGCGNGNSGSVNTNATQSTVATYKVNRGEFNWSGNEYTSLLPNQKEWNVSQYLIDDSRKCCSVIIDNSDLESTKQYVKSLEKTFHIPAALQPYQLPKLNNSKNGGHLLTVFLCLDILIVQFLLSGVLHNCKVRGRLG